MTAARIFDRVQFGYGKAASKLGFPHTLFRPTAPLTPALAPENRVRLVPFIASQSPDGSFKRPSAVGEATAYGMFDARVGVRVGDYLTGPTGTWFVASMEQLAIPMVVQCNAVVTISRPGGLGLSDEDTYSAVLPPEDTYSAETDGTTDGGADTARAGLLMRSWPASVLFGGRTAQGSAELPAEVGMKGFVAMLPAWPGLILRPSDRLTTADGMAFVLGGAELSSRGWRLDCTATVP